MPGRAGAAQSGRGDADRDDAQAWRALPAGVGRVHGVRRTGCKLLGFDEVRANVLTVRDGKLVGTVDGPIVDASVKRATLIEACAKLGIDRDATMALGDGANDMAMVEASGWGVAYRAKPALAEVADARLDHHGLDALLWAQGIPRAEWVEV